jgi:membrane protein YdbS with pleckstrin-like domain
MSSDLEAAPPTAVPDSVADGVYRSLDPHVVRLDRIVGAIVTACLSFTLALSVVIVWLAADTEWLARLLALFWPIMTALLAWSSYVWPEVSYRHASYRVDHLGIEIRRGVLWRREITVPRSRVQHIDVSQGPIERRFGLGRLSIYTAGTEYALVSLHGVTHARALLIRDHLLPKEAPDAV